MQKLKDAAKKMGGDALIDLQSQPIGGGVPMQGGKRFDPTIVVATVREHTTDTVETLHETTVVVIRIHDKEKAPLFELGHTGGSSCLSLDSLQRRHQYCHKQCDDGDHD